MQIASILVNLGNRSYNIIVGSSFIADIGNIISELCPGRKCVLITDTTVGKLYSDVALKSLAESGYIAGEIRLPEGEENKSLAIAEKCYHQMLSFGLDRKSFVIALGGGLIGDIAGFVAATFMRGIPFIQIPTTVLAAVDASVGGKTGVNLREGKNLIGVFHQPLGVFIDIDTFKTLEKRDVLSGFVELLKHALIRDKDFYKQLKNDYSAFLNLDFQATMNAVKKSCRIKADFVENDERESGSRAILNFGHTAGHAIESLSIAQSNPLRHGEAVSIGIAIALDISVMKGFLSRIEHDDVIAFMKHCGMPVSCNSINPDNIVSSIRHDKKNFGDKLRFIVLKRIGEASISDNVSWEDLFNALKKKCSSDG